MTASLFHQMALVSYDVKQRLLAGYIHSAQQNTQSHIKGMGVLPHAHFADIFLDEQQQAMSPLAQQIKPYIARPSPDIEVDIAIEAHQQCFTIQGWLKGHYDGRIRWYAINPVRQMPSSLWIVMFSSCVFALLQRSHKGK